MNKLINRLPIELFYHILSYSYNPQPIDLQKDIISYVNSKKEIMEIFHRRYHTLWTTYMDTNIINKHLTFHIQSFLTGLPNTYSDCKHVLDEVCTRLFIWNRFIWDQFILPDKNKHKLCISYRVLWGLLKVEERDHFLTIQKNMDKTRMP
jgi:hypothetical protein